MGKINAAIALLGLSIAISFLVLFFFDIHQQFYGGPVLHVLSLNYWIGLMFVFTIVIWMVSYMFYIIIKECE